MKYCTECSAEYQDSVSKCADCGGTELVPSEEMRRRGLRLPDDMDTRRFVRAATAEDPLSSEHFVSVLEAAQIPVFARSRRDGAVEPGSSMGWWEILVPEEALDRAVALITEERGKMDASSDEAAKAADEEEAEGEAAEARSKQAPS
ncbi:MAG: putative signal transducing protein [Myxococcaceae bacterium]